MKLNSIKHFIAIAFILLFYTKSKAQIIEKFNDSNFVNPEWLGDTSKFTFLNGKLRSVSTIANDKFYVSSKSNLVKNTIWSFWINLQFNTSSLNYTDIFLTSDSASLIGQNSGYYVRLGGTNDEICLYKKVKNVSTVIIDGKNGVLNHSNNVFKIKIICDSNYNFSLWRDSTGIGNDFVLEGTAVSNELKNSEFAGILIKQSTSSFFKLHFFDDFEISKIEKDTIKPFVKNAEAISLDTVKISFSEKMGISALDFSNYELNKSIGIPVNTRFTNKDSSTVEVVYSNKILPNVFYDLKIKNCKDKAGLNMIDTYFKIIKYKFEKPELYDLLISELMPDPDPQVNLPNAEYIEIFNNSSKIISLENCRIMDKTSFTVLPYVQIYPDSFLIVCEKSNENLFKKYGKTCGVVNMPSLNNSGDEIILRNSNGKLIHRVIYTTNTYGDNLKANGGWALEMIDKNNPCNETNYIASKSLDGGTPGKTNSVTSINTDTKKPNIIDVFVKSLNTVTFQFDESIDSASAVDFSNHSITNNTIDYIKSYMNEVEIGFTNKLLSNRKYIVEIKNIKDCSGNGLNDTSIVITMPVLPAKGQILINEILFNPTTGGYDYIEIYNNSDSTVYLQNLYLFNYNQNFLPDNFTNIDTSGRFIEPYSYKVFTESPEWVLLNYKKSDKKSFIKLSSLPALDDNAGHLGIADKLNNVIDEFDYNKSLHFELLTNTEGVSLEKINCKIKSSELSNWASAAASYGFGTPGTVNSHNLELKADNGFLNLSSPYFSPDEDGIDDIVSITINNEKLYAQATIIIFDINGFEIKKIANNIPLGNSQSWYWDGLDNFSKRTPIGIYIVYAEVMSTDGKLKTAKKTLTLGTK